MTKDKKASIEKLRKIKGEGGKDAEKTREPKKDEKEDKIKDLTETLQRLQAEFDNYRKRVEKEKCEFVKYSKAEIISKILPTLDSFELALKNKKGESFEKGVELIFSQLYQILEHEGLKPIEAAGRKFDPYLHDVLLKEKSDKEEDIVLEELQKGYMLNDKVIRHSKVKVSEKK